MKKSISVPFATTAILTLAEIKSAIDAFDRGDTNLFDTLNAIIVAVEARHASVAHDAPRQPRRRDAA